jgi:tRNA pseudouridine32 synthase/23S rRNA pseudouridine746 synthase
MIRSQRVQLEHRRERVTANPISWFLPQPTGDETPARFDATHPIGRRAAEQVMRSLRAGQISARVPSSVLYGVDVGKMFGVLVVRDAEQRIGFLRAFSGQLDGAWDVEGHAPPVFNRAQRDATEPRCEVAVRKFTARIRTLVASPRWAALQEAKRSLLERHANEGAELRSRLEANRAARHDGSGALITTGREDETEHRREKKRMREERDSIDHELKIFEQRLRRVKQLRVAASRISSRMLYDTYLFTNARGESRTLWQLCEPGAPPSGTGDCAAPKLLVQAMRNNLEPLALAEFWWGKAPRSGGKIEGQFYLPCVEKCGLVLPFLLASHC